MWFFLSYSLPPQRCAYLTHPTDRPNDRLNDRQAFWCSSMLRISFFAACTPLTTRRNIWWILQQVFFFSAIIHLLLLVLTVNNNLHQPLTSVSHKIAIIIYAASIVFMCAVTKPFKVVVDGCGNFCSTKKRAKYLLVFNRFWIPCMPDANDGQQQQHQSELQNDSLHTFALIYYLPRVEWLSKCATTWRWCDMTCAVMCSKSHHMELIEFSCLFVLVPDHCGAPIFAQNLLPIDATTAALWFVWNLFRAKKRGGN